MKNAKEIVRSIINSFYYNRSNEHVIKLCEEVKNRIYHYDVNWTEDGNIFYGILVSLYGDYGVSPRAGWLDSDIEEIVSCLKEEIKHLRGYLNEN